MKNPPASTGDAGSVSGLGGSTGGGNGNPLQYSCLGNPMDRRAWWATVHGITKESDTTRDKSPHAHTHTHTRTWQITSRTHTHTRARARTHVHTHILAPWLVSPWLPNIQIAVGSAGSWYHLDHSRVRRPCGILFGAASSFVTFTFSVCPATWSVFPTLSGWQTRFARGQDHQPLSAWPKNQDSWTKKWRWTPHSPFNTSLNDEAVPYPSFWKVTSVFTPRSCSVFLLSHTSAHCHKCPSRLNHTPLPSLSERCLFCCDCWLLSPSTAGQAPLTQGLVTVTCLYFAYFNQE